MRSKDHARSAVLCKGVLELSIKAERLWLHGGHNDACHHTAGAAHGMAGAAWRLSRLHRKRFANAAQRECGASSNVQSEHSPLA